MNQETLNQAMKELPAEIPCAGTYIVAFQKKDRLLLRHMMERDCLWTAAYANIEKAKKESENNSSAMLTAYDAEYPDIMNTYILYAEYESGKLVDIQAMLILTNFSEGGSAKQSRILATHVADAFRAKGTAKYPGQAWDTIALTSNSSS
jgi:hypothetical protein